MSFCECVLCASKGVCDVMTACRVFVLCVLMRMRDGGNGEGDDAWCMHARMMVVYSNIHKELNAQVKGAAKIMVSVVATRLLEAGDVLWRFEAKAAQDEPPRGNSNNRCVVVGLVAVGVWKLLLYMRFVKITCCAFLLSFIDTRE